MSMLIQVIWCQICPFNLVLQIELPMIDCNPHQISIIQFGVRKLLLVGRRMEWCEGLCLDSLWKDRDVVLTGGVIFVFSCKIDMCYMLCDSQQIFCFVLFGVDHIWCGLPNCFWFSCILPYLSRRVKLTSFKWCGKSCLSWFLILNPLALVSCSRIQSSYD